MNKKELIERIDKLPYFENPIADTVTINREWILKSIEQLDEPQKVTVPQIVADYIEYAKDCDWDLIDAMKGIGYEDCDDLLKWFYKDKNQETFARAWLDGYEVEKEKRYLVKMKNLRALFCYLAYIPDEGYWAFMASGGKGIVINHTRKELKDAGFGEVFNSQMFEVEEVE